MARSTNRQPFILIPRRTNGHWSLACSRVCHQENGLPSNRELALFFRRARRNAQLKPRTMRGDGAQTSPVNWPVLSADERCLVGWATFFSPLFGYAEITGSQTIARFLFPFLFTQRYLYRGNCEYCVVITAYRPNDLPRPGINQYRPRYNLMRSN